MEAVIIEPPPVNVWPAKFHAQEDEGSFSCIDLAVSAQGDAFLAAGCGESICIFASTNGDPKLECVSLLQPCAGRVLHVRMHNLELLACLCYSEVVVYGLKGRHRNVVLR
eukprot:765829-Hanusia_phi.AAC.2